MALMFIEALDVISEASEITFKKMFHASTTLVQLQNINRIFISRMFFICLLLKTLLFNLGSELY